MDRLFYKESQSKHVQLCHLYCLCCSVTQSCLTLCNPIDCSTPGFPVPHHLPKFALVHAHCISDTIHPSHPLTASFLSAFYLSAPGTFPMSQLFMLDHQSTGVSTSTSVLPMSIRSWFPFRLTCLVSLLFKEPSGVFSSTIIRRHQFFKLHLHYGPAFISVCDHWEDHSLDWMNLCQQSNVSALQHTL